MKRRKVDISKIGTLLESSANQVVTRGVQKTEDINFPVFATPVNEDILVYIPKTNLVVSEDGQEEMKVVNAHIHDYKKGKQYGQMRCISGLSGGIFDELGYDGSCPCCEANKEVWDLYNEKLKIEAEKLGLDVQNDTNDMLKPVKEKLRGEMELKNPEEYVTFPIVIIPLKGKMQPTDDAINNLKPVFVTWRKKRYEDSIIAQLEGLMENPGHPAGMFWLWKFTYNTEGKQATARDSAKNAKYMILPTDWKAKYGAELEGACEEVAKEFTNIKATEVLVANQFLYKEDVEEEVNKIMVKTRQQLDLLRVGGGQTTPLLEGVNPLDGYGSSSVGLD